MAHIRRPIPAGLWQDEHDDELSAARGVANGIVLGALGWSLIGLLVWFLV